MFLTLIQILFCGPLQASPGHRIGVMLPLTGKFAAPGLEVKRGIELAFERLNEQGSYGLELVFRDTMDSPELTTRAVEELARDEKVSGIIGPLVSGTVDAAADAAGAQHVPLLVLSQKASFPNAGEWAFRLFMTPEDQIRTLVWYAMDQLGYQRFAIAWPEQKYAMELVALFWDEVVKRGGQVVGAESYTPQTKDFNNLAQRLAGTFYTEIRKKEQSSGEREYLKAFEAEGKKPTRAYQLPPIVDYDALFIPDSYKGASLLASTLAWHNVPLGAFQITRDQKPVKLLGISSWNQSDLPSFGGQYVEECLFVDGFFAGSPSPDTAEMAGLFRAKHARSPDFLNAVGYDALNLLAGFLKLRALSAVDLRNGLQRLHPWTGVTGTLQFDANGEPTRDLFVVSVSQKSLTQLFPVMDDSSDSTGPSPSPRTFPNAPDRTPRQMKSTPSGHEKNNGADAGANGAINNGPRRPESAEHP